MAEERPLVYVWCVGNAMRSQMAEGFLNQHGADRVRVVSAGTHPLGQVIPEVARVMLEKGVDISNHTSDAIEADLVADAAYVLDLGGRGKDRVPAAHAHKYERWDVPDPFGLGMDGLRETRDRIEEMVLEFLKRVQGTTG